jgi:hypothetical protein
MTKLLVTSIAIGCGLLVNAASAQDVKSDRTKRQQQEQIMQEKEKGADHATPGGRDRATTNDGRVQNGAQAGANGSQTSTQKQIPEQSMPSVGHPKEGASVGQAGIKKYDERTGGARPSDSTKQN